VPCEAEASAKICRRSGFENGNKDEQGRIPCSEKIQKVAKVLFSLHRACNTKADSVAKTEVRLMMTSKEIQKLIKKYRFSNAYSRQKILLQLFASSGRPGIHAFALSAGIDQDGLWKYITTVVRIRRRSKKQQKVLEQMPEPPRLPCEIDPREAAAVAQAAAGGLGEVRFAKRDTTRSTVTQKTRKMQLYQF